MVHRLSFRAIGTPASGPGLVARGDLGVDRRRRRSRLVGEHEVEGVQLGVALGDAGEVLFDHVRRRRLPDRTARHDLRHAPCDRHGASPRMGGTRKRPASACGRGGEHLVAVERRADDVVAEDVLTSG